MEILILSVSLILPWLTGMAWLIAAESGLGNRRITNRLRQLGYGYFIGLAVLYFTIQAMNRLSGAVSWSAVMTVMAVLAIGSLPAWWWMQHRNAAVACPERAQGQNGQWNRWLIAGLLAWTGFHLFFIASEIITLPVYPWDAWSTWLYRSKAWFLSGHLSEVVSSSQWLRAESPDVFTVKAWTYPEFPSVIPFWAALSLGRWSETLVNLPVLFAGIAMGLGLYGQCRESGLGTLAAVLAVYLLFSVPLFATHLALAGYADIWMAGFAGLGFVAIIRGNFEQRRAEILLGFVLVAMGMLVKNEGVVWFLLALTLQWLCVGRLRYHAMTVAGLAVVAAGAAWAGFRSLEIPLLGVLGWVDGELVIPFIGRFELEMQEIGMPYLHNLFGMGSWNLLWLFVLGALILVLLKPATHKPDRVQRTYLTFLALFTASQIFIFGFTTQGAWADTYTAINRLPLHFVVSLVFLLTTAVGSRWSPGEAFSPSVRDGGRFITIAVLSALVVTAVVFTFLGRDLKSPPEPILDMGPSGIEFIRGSGSLRDGYLWINRFEGGFAAISSGPIALDASAHHYLEYNWNPGSDRASARLFWRNADDSRDLVQASIRKTGSGILDLSRHPRWRGKIIEFGMIFEDDSGAAIEFGGLRLNPDQLSIRARLLWQAWSAPEPWSQKSINFLYGGGSRQAFSLTSAVALWAVLCLTFLAGLSGMILKLPSRALAGFALSFMLTGWMILDFRWSLSNARNAAAALEQRWFSSDDERLAMALDGNLYRQIKDLKTGALPAGTSRILVLGDGRVADFLLQRSRYHLLPHSSHLPSRLTDRYRPDSIDYVLYLGDTSELENLGSWRRLWAPRTEKLGDMKSGAIYRVRKLP
jgi:hypothetical protein